MNLKKIGKLFTSKFVGTGPSSYEKRIYRAAVSQRLRNTGIEYNSVFVGFRWLECERQGAKHLSARRWMRMEVGWMFRELCRWEVGVPLGLLPMTRRYLDWITWESEVDGRVVSVRVSWHGNCSVPRMYVYSRYSAWRYGAHCVINTLNVELNPICNLLALLRAHFLHVSRIRVKSLTLRLLMSYVYIYMERLFLMFLDHTQRRSTVCRTPLGELVAETST